MNIVVKKIQEIEEVVECGDEEPSISRVLFLNRIRFLVELQLYTRHCIDDDRIEG